jgi:low affinity Fe/Cu permease
MRLSYAPRMSVREAIEDQFEALAAKVSWATGSFWAFTAAVSAVVVWAALGPLFHFSSEWQLVINTGTTIVTFLMVFVIQHAQNKDIRAVHLKLNELIAALEGASNRLIDVEDLSDRELDHLYARYRHLAKRAGTFAPGAQTSVEAEREAVDYAEEEAREKARIRAERKRRA